MILERRRLLKAHDYDAIPHDDWWEPHQRKGVPPPPLEIPFDESITLIDLINPEDFTIGKIPLIDAIANRESRRVFTNEPLTLEELSFLLWSTQGVRVVDENRVWTKRVVPSGGGRQPFETYLLVNRISGIERGIYRYLPIEHKLILVSEYLPDADELMEKVWYQNFIGKSAVVFVWAAIPYKTEWRYSIISYKDILIEAGHICQNLYLACEAISAGTCAIAAYEQKAIDELIRVDGENEMAVYISPVGKINPNQGART
ncbi:MAG: SagB/ThcOx family dehydrogenase [Candidatus Thorarchaeota archaeon]|nr:SagB/ThcOx family dehydrogenase [Candidatus Thorarchaeota archaeon]